MVLNEATGTGMRCKAGERARDVWGELRHIEAFERPPSDASLGVVAVLHPLVVRGLACPVPVVAVDLNRHCFRISLEPVRPMPVNLSIHNIPDEIAERLRERARRSHRSLQGELMAILEESVLGRAPLTPAEALAEVRRLGVQTPEESVQMVRQERDG